MTTGYRINDLFLSIDGEPNYWGQGRLSKFIRLQGCNMKCSYCDTKVSWDFEQGKPVELDSLIRWVKKDIVRNITITGGEPLAQNIKPLVLALTKLRCKINIETNGSLEPKGNWIGFENIAWTIDVKITEPERNSINEKWIKKARHLEKAMFKFVVSNCDDIKEATYMMSYFGLQQNRCIISPVINKDNVILDPNVIVKMLKDLRFSEVIIGIQIHKLLGLK